ncbi:bromodomain-containing protein DDB_G0280777-like [Salarias fasciatus]|uniref:bromodomain-containing protein DDB_G0280777-like n=1 Tax=Salarias fasciatus TaxID=181472 RepID=UPI0011764E27|nr:bromodomain-containing protein DDB_G0280777-like [Salarias fasciatus]
MSSVQALREFINQRLTAAAGEIFTVFEATIVHYEEEMARQRELLQISCQHHQIKLTELPQQQDCTEEQLFKLEANDCVEQEEPEPPQIKEEPETPQIRDQAEPQNQHIKEEQEESEPPQMTEQEELCGSMKLKVVCDPAEK